MSSKEPLPNVVMGQPVLTTAPALSTSASHIFDQEVRTSNTQSPALSDEQILLRYEIDRTLQEIKEARYSRIALQFPDDMLQHAPRVAELMAKRSSQKPSSTHQETSSSGVLSSSTSATDGKGTAEPRYFILGDTSYGSCCIDEIAAEHVDADVVVHFGRACLSPSARLPAIYAFTMQPLNDVQSVLFNFMQVFQDKQQKLVLMADCPYQYALPSIKSRLEGEGYCNVFVAAIHRDPDSPLPNRSVPDEVGSDPFLLKDWHVFHLGQPAEALLLTLSSHVGSMRVCSVDSSGQLSLDETPIRSVARLLSRRYALVTTAASASIFGVLINTLSVKNYLVVVEHVKQRILEAGKKSYTFVVGKLNTAKVSNFSEIDAWVVIGCWESSLITSKDFYKPMITPYELELALQTDEERMWTGNWDSNYQSVLDAAQARPEEKTPHLTDGRAMETAEEEDPDMQDSAPPVFDLRTGRYVSNSRPMQRSNRDSTTKPSDTALLKLQKGELMNVGGEFSPGASYLNTQRQWKGLGSDFGDLSLVDQEGATMQEGQTGIASGYRHGSSEKTT